MCYQRIFYNLSVYYPYSIGTDVRHGKQQMQQDYAQNPPQIK
jgi:hypothetical protein